MDKVSVDGLTPAEQRAVDVSIDRITATVDNNVKRSLYADQKVMVKALGIDTSARYDRVRTVLGWPSKAVRSLSTICRNEGPSCSDGEDRGEQQWWRENNMRVEASQGQTLSLVHGPAFLVTTKGDEQAGEPLSLTTVKAATSGSGEWNPRSRRMSFFLSVHETSNGDAASGSRGGRPVRMTLYVPGKTIDVVKLNSGWAVQRTDTFLPFVPVAPLVYQGRHDRPFGSSRVSPAVMAITDAALRTIVRAELGAEAYINPQRWLLGADMSQFAGDDGVVNMDTVWRQVLGRVIAIGPNENTENPNTAPIVPQVGQFPQLDMTPHMSQLESWAAQFAAETDLPVSSLGITHTQNPASAEAIVAAKDDLINEADRAMLEWSGAWEQAAMTAFMIREGLSEAPRDFHFNQDWRDPRTPSAGAAADAVFKLTQGDRPILPPESDVVLKRLRYSRAEIDQIQADRRRYAGRAVLADIVGRQG